MNYSGIEFLDIDNCAKAELEKVLETLNIGTNKTYKIASCDFLRKSQVAGWCRIPCECRKSWCKRVNGYLSKKVYKIAYETSFPYTDTRYYGDDYVRVIKIYTEIERSPYTYYRMSNGDIAFESAADAISSSISNTALQEEIRNSLDDIAYVADVAFGSRVQDAADYHRNLYSGDYYWSNSSTTGTSSSMAGIQYATNYYSGSWAWNYSRYDGTHR